MVSLQAALPASFYVDEGHWRRERDAVLHNEWFCVGRLSAHGLDGGSRERLAVIDVAGELRCTAPVDPWKLASPKVKMPPSPATIQ